MLYRSFLVPVSVQDAESRASGQGDVGTLWLLTGLNQVPRQLYSIGKLEDLKTFVFFSVGIFFVVWEQLCVARVSVLS
jgi:hypothetical protein